MSIVQTRSTYTGPTLPETEKEMFHAYFEVADCDPEQQPAQEDEPEEPYLECPAPYTSCSGYVWTVHPLNGRSYYGELDRYFRTPYQRQPVQRTRTGAVLAPISKTRQRQILADAAEAELKQELAVDFIKTPAEITPSEQESLQLKDGDKPIPVPIIDIEKIRAFHDSNDGVHRWTKVFVTIVASDLCEYDDCVAIVESRFCSKSGGPQNYTYRQFYYFSDMEMVEGEKPQWIRASKDAMWDDTGLEHYGYHYVEYKFEDPRPRPPMWRAPTAQAQKRKAQRPAAVSASESKKKRGKMEEEEEAV